MTIMMYKQTINVLHGVLSTIQVLHGVLITAGANKKVLHGALLTIQANNTRVTLYTFNILI